MATDLEIAQTRLAMAMELLSIAQEKAAAEAALNRAVEAGSISAAKRAELVSAENARFTEQSSRIDALDKGRAR